MQQDETDRSNDLLAQLSKLKGKLRPTETRVTLKDGSHYVEKKGQEGKLILEFKGHTATPQYIAENEAGMSSLKPYSFDPVKKCWIAVAHSTNTIKEAQKVESLTFVSYNVWFAEHKWKERAKAMFEILEKSAAHVICLQEVTPHFLELLSEQDWVRRDYVLSDSPKCPTTVIPYGVAMLSKLELQNLSLHTLPSNMGRRLLLAELCIQGEADSHKVKIGTVHLESRSQYQMRKSQLDCILPLLKISNNTEHSFLMGDFNFCSDSFEERLNFSHQHPPEFRDTWPCLHPHREGLTMPGMMSRIDRVLHQSRSFVPVAMQMIGTEAIDESSTDKPSDHYGLYAAFVLSTKEVATN